jgi:hypothetical protein
LAGIILMTYAPGDIHEPLDVIIFLNSVHGDQPNMTIFNNPSDNVTFEVLFFRKFQTTS